MQQAQCYCQQFQYQQDHFHDHSESQRAEDASTDTLFYGDDSGQSYSFDDYHFHQFYLGAGVDVVNLRGNNNHLFTEEGSDRLTVRGNTNEIDLGLGDDYLRAYGDSLTVESGLGNDLSYLYGDNNQYVNVGGNDRVYLFGDNNEVNGGNEQDWIFAYGNNALLNLNDGNDYGYISGSYSYLNTGDGHDKLRAYGLENQVFAGSGNDDIYLRGDHSQAFGESGDDVLRSWDGDHIFNAGSGADTIVAGKGHDTINHYVKDNHGFSDNYNGGAGNDQLNLFLEHSFVSSQAEALAFASVNDYVSALENHFAMYQSAGVDFSSFGFDLVIQAIEQLTIAVENAPKDESASLHISDASVVEGDHLDNHFLEFSMTLSHAVGHQVSVDFTSMGIDAVSIFNSDVVLDNGTIKFNAGETEKLIRLQVYGDNAFEADESVEINLFNVQGANLSRAQATGTILNDDVETDAATNVKIYNSKADAQKVLYIDVDGEWIENTIWNDRENRGEPFKANAYNTDGSFTDFSEQEHQEIKEIWEIVAEDFALYNVNVTTDRSVYDAAEISDKAMLVMSSNNITGLGSAWTNSFGSEYKGVSFVGPNHTDNVRQYGDTVSHELGHMLGLAHDGIKGGTTYYSGHGEVNGGWAPIMGFSPAMMTAQWSQGEYLNADQKEDDIMVMTRHLDIRQDDHGDTFDDASLLHMANGHQATGNIHSRADVDVFKFIANESFAVRLNVDRDISNLNAQITLKDQEGEVLAQSGNNGMLFKPYLRHTPDGEEQFYIEVDGIGFLEPGSTGFSDYGSLGQYTLNFL